MTPKEEVLTAITKLPDIVGFEEIIKLIESLPANLVGNADGSALRETSPLYETKSVKSQVIKSVERIQDDASFEDITERVRVLAAVQDGLDSLDRGEGVPIEEVEKMIASWITK